jgi:hypothetical protein
MPLLTAESEPEKVDGQISQGLVFSDYYLVATTSPSLSLPKPQKRTLASLSDENVYSPALLDKVLTALAKCESGGNPERINPNDMGSPSYGKYQFKQGTWITQLRKYGYFPEAEDNELMNFVLDEDIQDELTRKIILDNGWRHWTNCFQGLDLPRAY